MTLVDSTGWIEYFAELPRAKNFAPALERHSDLLVPTICIYEVHKRIRSLAGRKSAVTAVAAMRRGLVVDLDTNLALRASRWSSARRLPMADSIILATARAHLAELWTLDAHFKGLPGVKFMG